MPSDKYKRWFLAILLAIGFALVFFPDTDLTVEGTNDAGSQSGRVPVVSAEAAGTTVPEGRGSTSPTAGGPDTGDRDLPVFDFMAITGIQEILDALGIDRDFEAWASERGFHWGFDPKSSPYAVLSMEELRELAESGDMAAVLALAMAMRNSDPAAALDQLHGLAMKGSLDAMSAVGATYGGIDYVLAHPDQSDLPHERIAELQALVQQGVDPELESMAWSLLFSSYMGYPRSMGNPRSGDAFSRFRQACGRAVELREQVEMQAAADGRSVPDIEAAPFAILPIDGDSLMLAACPSERLPMADLSSCQPIQVLFEGEPFAAFVCPEP